MLPNRFNQVHNTSHSLVSLRHERGRRDDEANRDRHPQRRDQAEARQRGHRQGDAGRVGLLAAPVRAALQQPAVGHTRGDGEI